MSDRNALLALHLTGVVGPRRLLSAKKKYRDLWDVFGAEEESLSQLPDWNPSCARKVLSLGHPLERVQRELHEGEQMGAHAWVEGDEDFPKVFEGLYDPPFVLWRKGDYRPEDEKAIAVVGCRHPTVYGALAAKELAGQIASYGYTVVSGLARGIDTAAHSGALELRTGRTLAFLGSGLGDVYPPENKALAERIVERGAVLSEYPLAARPLALHFPQRNRLISGASRGVLVVEAGEGSGSLITVDHALEQGKTVFAVPGPIHAPQSQGTLELIRQGAKLAARAEDILLELGELVSEPVRDSRTMGGRPKPTAPLTEEEAGLIEFLTCSPIHLDGLARESGLPARRLNEMMLVLEMKGYVRQVPGNQFVRA